MHFPVSSSLSSYVRLLTREQNRTDCEVYYKLPSEEPRYSFSCIAKSLLQLYTGDS